MIVPVRFLLFSLYDSGDKQVSTVFHVGFLGEIIVSVGGGIVALIRGGSFSKVGTEDGDGELEIGVCNAGELQAANIKAQQVSALTHFRKDKVHLLRSACHFPLWGFGF